MHSGLHLPPLPYLHAHCVAAHVGGVVGKEIGAQRGEELVAGRVLQHDVHSDVVGEDTVAQGLHRLVVLHHLGFLHVLGPDVVGELVILSLAQVKPLHGEAADGLSPVFDLPVLLHVYAGQLPQHVLEVVVALSGKLCQVVDDGVAAHRHGRPLHLHFLELESLLDKADDIVPRHGLAPFGIAHEGGLQLVALPWLRLNGEMAISVGPHKLDGLSATQQHHVGLGQTSTTERVDHSTRDGVLGRGAHRSEQQQRSNQENPVHPLYHSLKSMGLKGGGDMNLLRYSSGLYSSPSSFTGVTLTPDIPLICLTMSSTVARRRQ